MKDIYKDTRLRVTCYMVCSENKWISAAWRRENTKKENSIVEEATKTMDYIGVEIQFEGDNIWTDGELINGGWKPAWKRLKEMSKKEVKNQRVKAYGAKEQQSKFFRGQEQECHVWLSQNLNPGKMAATMTILEQMVETRSWKEARRLKGDGSCRIITQNSVTVVHLVAGYIKLV